MMIRLGDAVSFVDDDGHMRAGQIWSHHERVGWYWIAVDGQMFSRPRKDIFATPLMHTSHIQEMLL